MPKLKTAPFIAIEALDAGGSQTQTDGLVKRLRQQGLVPLQLHFPQEDRATGQLIYQKFLLHKNKYPFTAREQALLYIQDFYSRLEEITAITGQPFRQRLVVADRFFGSTFAYQTIGVRGPERAALLKWLEWLCLQGKPRLPIPDVVIFLDTPVAVSLKRLKDKKKDFFETKEKLTAIRDNYLLVAKKYRWQVVASVTPQGEERTREDLHEEIWQLVTQLLAGSL